MGFMNSYKRLEKICGEMFDVDRGVSAYIDEMNNNPDGSYMISGWDDDLKNLKHYRWLRNQIAHEPDFTEESMCEVDDERWVNDFYYRIMNQSDPLALYYKKMKDLRERNRNSTNSCTQYCDEENTNYRTQHSAKPSGCALSVMIFIFILAFFAIAAYTILA